MKAIHWIIAAAALAFVHPLPASAAQGDAEVIIYRFPGVRENGGASFVGVATVFHCTNFSGVTETLRLVTRDAQGPLLANYTINVPHLSTVAASHLCLRGPVCNGHRSCQPRDNRHCRDLD